MLSITPCRRTLFIMIALVAGVGGCTAARAQDRSPGDVPVRISVPSFRHGTQHVSAPKSGPGETGEHSVAEGKGDTDFEWTKIEVSKDSRLVYVSDSEGSDSNSGLSEKDPVKTIEHGKSLLREGYPDFLLLKRGDVWEDQAFGRWKLSGRSEDEPIVVSSYGKSDARPVVRTGNENRGFWLDGGDTVEHVAIMGIEMFANKYTGDAGSEAGILFLGKGGDILIEDCLVRGYKDNIVLSGFNGTLEDVAVRGCVIVDAYSKIAHAQGLYASKTKGLLIEGCVFDHNGWNESVAGAEPTIFNHNIYIQADSSDVTVRQSMVMNGSSHGMQLRPGGVCEDNLIIYNAIGVLVGYGDMAPVTATVRGNVIMHGDDISPDKPRGMGIDVQNVGKGEITGNVIAHNESAKPYGHAIKLHSSGSNPVSNLRIAENTIFDWQGGLKFAKDSISNVHVARNVLQGEDASVPIIKHEGLLSAVDVRYRNNVYHSKAVPVSWFQVGVDTYNFGAWKDLAEDQGSAPTDLDFVDSKRTVATYQAMIGGGSGLDGFIEAARSQSRLTWNENYSVPAILAYLREGYVAQGAINASLGQVDE